MRTLAVLGLIAAPLAAQDAPVATPTVVPPPVVPTEPTPAATASPTIAPMPTPTTAATPSPAASTTPRRREPTPTVSALPTPPPTVAPSATPDRAIVSAPTPTATPAPLPTEPEPATRDRTWLAALALALLGVAAAGFVLARRRRTADGVEQDVPIAPVVPPSSPVPPLPPMAQPAIPAAPAAGSGIVTSSLRPKIVLALRPLRAGVETLRARVEYELTVGNTGSALAAGLNVELVLLSAGNSHDRLLAQFWAEPRGAPVANGITVEVGGAILVTGEALMDRDAIETITAADRRMFVPMIAARVLSASGNVLARGAWLIGVERAGAAKLAPLALDRSGMRGGLAARDYLTG